MKYEVHPNDKRCTCFIVGDDINDAVESNLDKICIASKGHSHLTSDYRLISLEYHPDILGLTGGYVARVEYYDHVTNCRESVDGWIYTTEDGLPRRSPHNFTPDKPTVKSEVLNLRITPELKAELQSLAAAENRSMSNYIEMLIRREVDRT